MLTEDKLKQAYRSLQDKALEFGSHLYFPIYEHPELAPSDPVAELARGIEFAFQETCQLFSGFRGTGKSTELLRLKHRLQQDAHTKVVLCDMQSYLNLNSPVDVADFLLAISGALSDAMNDDALLGEDPSRESFWTRFWHYLNTTEVDPKELGISAGISQDGVKAGAHIKANLKADPSFLRRLQAHMKGRLGALRTEVHGFFAKCLNALKAKHGKRTRLVVIFDSVEHFRGTSVNDEAVAASVEVLFRGHADTLRVPHVHTIYTVPPWLRLRSPGVGEGYDGYEQVPCVKLWTRDGEEFRPGFKAIAQLISKRLNWMALLGSRAAFDELCRMSGGYLRDLFRLLRDCIIKASLHGAPLPDAQRQLAIDKLRNAYQGFSNQDAVWLKRIHASGEADLDEAALLHNLARFFDTHLVLAYRNGKEWYGVHPIIRDEALRRADAYLARVESPEA